MPSLTQMPAALAERRDDGPIGKSYGARRRAGCSGGARSLRTRALDIDDGQGRKRQAECRSVYRKLTPAEQVPGHGVDLQCGTVTLRAGTLRIRGKPSDNPKIHPLWKKWQRLRH